MFFLKKLIFCLREIRKFGFSQSKKYYFTFTLPFVLPHQWTISALVATPDINSVWLLLSSRKFIKSFLCFYVCTRHTRFFCPNSYSDRLFVEKKVVCGDKKDDFYIFLWLHSIILILTCFKGCQVFQPNNKKGKVATVGREQYSFMYILC